MSDEEVPRVEPVVTLDGPARFRMALFVQTPRVWVTTALVVINVAVFAAMVAAGIGILSPSIDGLIRWGANYGPRTTSGQWWRLLSSAFVHIGVLHLAMNMIGLWQIGFLVERLLGNRVFLATYLFAGLCGGVVSVAWNPVAVSAGASGAVFGVYGVLFAYLVRHRGSIPREVLASLQRGAIFFIGLNLAYGLQVKGIDMGAHVGGLLGGFAAALVVARPLGAVRTRGSGGQLLVLLLGALVILAAAWAFLPRAVDVQTLMADFQTMERGAIDAYNGTLERRRKDEVSDREVADILDGKILPPWREFERRLRSIGRVPRQQKKRIDDLVRYMDLRGRGWAIMSEALRGEDPAKGDEATRLQREAEALLKAPDSER